MNLSNYPIIRDHSNIIPKLTEIRDSLICVNNELTIIGHVTEEISGLTFRLSQMIIFNIGAISKIIELTEPENKPKSTHNDFCLFSYMTTTEKATYDQIAGLRHQIISEWKIIEDQKHQLLRTIRDRLKSQRPTDNINIDIEY